MKNKSTTATFDEDAPITQGDIDTGRLVLRKRAAGGGVVLPKKRVTVYLDAAESLQAPVCLWALRIGLANPT